MALYAGYLDIGPLIKAFDSSKWRDFNPIDAKYINNNFSAVKENQVTKGKP